MKFDQFLNDSWAKHGQNPQLVAKNLIDLGLELVQSNEQVIQLAHLSTHIFGEHLGEPQAGIELIQKLKLRPGLDQNAQSGLNRSELTLEIIKGPTPKINHLSISDQVRVLAVAASAFSGLKKIQTSLAVFQQCLDLAQQLNTPNDPAYRALAVTGNNLSSTLEELDSPSEDEGQLMIYAAHVARKYWELAGTWLEVERAEYRLSKSYLKAKKLKEAILHAQNCLEASTENKASALDFFFGYEALAMAEHAKGNSLGWQTALSKLESYFKLLDDNDKVQYGSTLSKIKQMI